MVTRQIVGGFVIAGCGLLTVCASLADFDSRPVVRPWRPDGLHPVAALAWAQLHCDVELSLQPGTPRIQGEDFLRMAAKLEALQAKRGRSATCLIATKLAADVAAGAEADTPDGLVAMAK